MNTKEMLATESPEADAQAVLDHVISGTPVEPTLAKRVRERAEVIRRQILASHGVQDIGVDLIRELRGEVPQS